MNQLELKQAFFPKAVQDYHDYIENAFAEVSILEHQRTYIRNISYSLQYLEYLDDSIKNYNHHIVVKIQLIKTYLVTGCSIIESILWLLLKMNDQNKKIQWEEIERRETNIYKKDDVNYKFEVTQFRELSEPIDVEMKFVDMCKKAQTKRLLGIESSAYAKLNHMRRLRNRVHIHAVQHDGNSDYWSFSEKDFNTMTEVLGSVLLSNRFNKQDNYKQLFSWMKKIENKIEMPSW